MYLSFFLALIFYSSSIFALSDEKINSLHLIQDCNILNMNGDVLKSLPGKMCIFFNDGSFISANEQNMKLYDKDNTILWKIDGHFHHQLALSDDRKKILAFASGEFILNGQKKREDKILVISLQGKILAEQTSSHLLKMARIPLFDWVTSPWLKFETGKEKEISHFNSIYEIPKNINDVEGSPLKAGNFIINGLTQGILIVTPDLKKIVFNKILKTSSEHFIHDVQVTDMGNIIYFNNITAVPSKNNLFSTIQEYDLLNEKIVFEFKSDPEAMFFSRYCGSVQELDADHILFSDKFNGTYIYSRVNKKLFLTVRGTHFQNRVPVYNQTTKAKDLSLFIKNSKR